MAGISRKWIWAPMVLLLAFSCIKEQSLEEPVNPDEERFAEFDPVVRFGLDTYMGTGEPVTKTTYAGDDKTIVLDNVRYERINWNAKLPSEISGAEASTYTRDLVQIHAESGQEFGPNKNLLYGNYYATEIKGVTNPDTDVRRDAADATPASGSESDNFYWSASKDERRFYALYPSPDLGDDYYALAPGSRLAAPAGFVVDESEHKATVAASINKRPRPHPEEVGADDPSREQKYLWVNNATPSCYEYMPNMRHAYMYAAAVMPGADAGYKKVPLRFKPLYSAVKLIVTARDAGAKKYRLKRVDLRTDLHNNGSKDGRADLNPDKGTALGGSFSTSFKADATTGTTADFTPVTAVSDTLKRLFIDIDPDDRIVLGDNTLKLTFLVLPIEQSVMTVDYTFEYLKGSELNPSDPGYRDPAVAANWLIPGNVVEVHRYLSLQRKTDQKDNKGLHNEFSENDWYTLDPATKLYVKSNVPEIQYYFDVVMQGNLPRTWKKVIDGSKQPLPKSSREDFTIKDFFEAKDFYAVVSYRDSSGFKQPLRWKVTGYRPEGKSSFSLPKPASVSWLNLRGDGPWDKLVPFDVEDANHPGYPYDADYDPWVVVQGQGTKMKDELYDPNTGCLIGYQNFASSFYNFYDAGAPDNGTRSWGWVNHGSYIHSTPDGEFKHHANDGVDFPDSTAWKRQIGEAYAFDLSSHDIYGKLTAAFNGDPNTATTANCYVVSSPGWYRFPAVYGNALKGGANNTIAYNKDVLNDPTSGIMGAYLDHDDQEITDPWIPYSIKSVEVVWDDANRMVSELKDDPTRMDRRPFCETIDGRQYIYFYVDDIAQGNALIAAKDASGTIVWSWHIWAVTNPEESLATIELESNQTVLDPYTPLSDDQYSDPKYPDRSIGWNILLSGYNYSAYPTAAQAPLEFPFAKKSSVKNIFWRRADLGQNGKETGAVDPRYCDVEFTQYFKGKVVAKVVRRFLQSGVEDDYSITPVYQWGRKDPMRTPKTSPVELTNADIGTQRTGRTIQCPEEFYYGDAAIPFTGIRYDNLWNNNITIAVYDSRCDDERNRFPGASKDRNVAKTIYDPSPAGFVMPNMYAFSAFNPYGTINQTRFPGNRIDEIAYDAASTYKTDGTGYIDFYAKYDASAPYKRKKDPNQTIRIFVSGRLKGTDNSAARANPELLYLWTSEPAVWNGYYGRSFCTQSALGTGAWGLNPVTGVSSSEPDPTAPGSLLPCVRTGGSQPKWQRSHAEPVRPMVEQP